MSGDAYPGAGASVHEIVRRADAYRMAAGQLRYLTPLDPEFMAPCRFCAAQAIELYLNAFLAFQGEPPERIRSLGHDYKAKAEIAAAAGLDLRQKTANHLSSMTQAREYLVLRYHPDMASLSQLNRLWATLDEVTEKVGRALADERRGGRRSAAAAG